MFWVFIVLGVLVLTVLWLVLTYNGLVKSRNKVEEAWSGIDVQLKRRHDLVPNLVEIVRGYAAHEREALVQVVGARADAIAANQPLYIERAEAKLTSALGSLTAVAEAYPELKASESFRRLQAELAATEDEIQAARRIYNANVRALNTRVQSFPSVLVANVFHFGEAPYFEVDPAVTAPPVVSAD